MKLIHLSDLHIGKRVNECSVLEDQKFILRQILDIIDGENADGVLIAGDVYDKPIPPAEAVSLFDSFLTALAQREKPVFLISGNHDSAERLAFGARLFAQSGIYVSEVYQGTQDGVELKDSYGSVVIHLLPFVKPATVRHAYPEAEIGSYQDAVAYAISQMKIDRTKRNVLLSHQFVTGAARCESEEVSVGGLDQVDASIYRDFDYVALGHIHSPQNLGENLRYCGTPLKYSFSEAKHQKSVTVVELKEKGTVEISSVPLTPLRDLREIRGTYLELTKRENYVDTNTEDYIHAILTDEEDVPDALAKLRAIYPNIMRLSYDNRRTRESREVQAMETVEEKSPLALFEEFYEVQNNDKMSAKQVEFVEKMIEKIWEEQV